MVFLDDKWFHSLKSTIETADDEVWLKETMRVRAQERRRFMEDEVENPHFTYINRDFYTYDTTPLKDLKSEVEQSEKNPVIQQLYVKKLESQILRREMLKATIEGNDKDYFKSSQSMYGKTKKEFFAYVASRVVKLCNNPKSTQQEKAAKALLRIFSKIDSSNAVLKENILPPIVKQQSNHVNAATISDIFQSVLDRFDITGWIIEIDSTNTRQRFSVSGSKKIVYIPNDSQLALRKEKLTRLHAEALAEHEIGVHVRRAVEGSLQPLLLLSTGLAQYLRGEEGIASYIQQQLEGANEFYGFDRYLATSLAVGMDGTPRDFRSVFALMFNYFILVLKDSTDLTDRARNAAWEVCVRIFRGTTGQSVGNVHTRDILYMEGNIGIWQLLIDKPQMFEYFFVGKYDPLNKEHVTALQKLDILPVF